MPSSLNQTPEESTKSKIKKKNRLHRHPQLHGNNSLLLFLLQCTDFNIIEQSPLFYLLGGLFVGVASAFLLIEMFWAENPLIPVDMIQKACGGYFLAQAFLAVGRNAVRSLSSLLYRDRWLISFSSDLQRCPISSG